MAISKRVYRYWDIRMAPEDKQSLEIEGVEAIKNVIRNIFQTPYGDRGGIFMPNFGNRLHYWLHEPINGHTAVMMKMALIEDMRLNHQLIKINYAETTVEPVLNGILPGYVVKIVVEAAPYLLGRTVVELTATAN